jgi:hypothetical protein
VSGYDLQFETHWSIRHKLKHSNTALLKLYGTFVVLKYIWFQLLTNTHYLSVKEWFGLACDVPESVIRGTWTLCT